MGEKLDEAVAQVSVRKAPPNRMFLQIHGANGTLPDGRGLTIGSTCGAGGVSLIICVIDNPNTLHHFTVSGEEVVRALLANGALEVAS
jgi:hypothetical protein